MEGAELGVFMVMACAATIVVNVPAFHVRGTIPVPVVRRVLVGICMGLTATAIIYSPWGKQSGAHFNPAVTLTFFRLGLVHGWDALFYVLAQFVGGLIGVLLAAVVFSGFIADPAVDYIVTTPGPAGPGLAFIAETLLAFILISVVLTTTNHPGLARYTGFIVGGLVALFIAVEAPISGMSINPARTLASALPVNDFSSLWLYFVAPPLGMLLAAELYLRTHPDKVSDSAKLHHAHDVRCIFRCGGHDATAAIPLTA